MVNVGLLSWDKDRLLTLLMATVTKPKILLLDEHTAVSIQQQVLRYYFGLIRLSPTKANSNDGYHDMQQAIGCRNRLIMMYNGQIIYDVKGEEKEINCSFPYLRSLKKQVAVNL